MPSPRLLQRPPLLPIAVIASGLLLTGAAVRFAVNRAESVDARRIEVQVHDLVGVLRERLDVYRTLLVSTRSFIEATGGVHASEFATYVERLDPGTRFPGLQGIGFTQWLRPGDAARVEAGQQARIPGFHVWPGPDAQTTIVLLEPLDLRNRRAIGFDMWSEPVRREAMQRALETGVAALSGRVVLVQEAEGHEEPGFLVYMPYYGGADPAEPHGRRERIAGFVYAPFQAQVLFEGVLPPARRRDLEVAIYDGDEPVPGRLLYRDHEPAPDHARRIVRVERTTFAGRTWTLTFAATPRFLADSPRREPLWVALGGLVITLLVAFVTRAEVARRIRAERRARELRFAANASATLASTLEVDALLVQVTRLAVPKLAERVHVAVRDPDGRVHEARLSGDEPLQVSVRGDEALDRVVGDEVHALVSRGERIGMLAISGEGWVSVAERGPLATELARFAAATLDNAMLYAQAQAAVRLRDDFLSIASHELKTPVTALSLQLQMLARRFTGHADARVLRLVDNARRQTTRLGALITNLLDLSRLQGGRLPLNLEPVDFGEVVRDVATRHAEELALAGCTLVLEAPGGIVGRWDRLRVEQIVTNLLSNAVKYGRNHPVTVDLQQSGRTAVLSVRDEGIGIAPADQGRVFERFARAVSVTHYGGLGLGLYIVREIVESLGGEILVESEVDRGSTFRVVLPLAGPRTREPGNGPPRVP